MPAMTYEGHVENGVIRLERNIRLPEKARVFVVVPEGAEPPVVRLRSPRLIRAEDAAAFTKEVTEEPPHGKV